MGWFLRWYEVGPQDYNPDNLGGGPGSDTRPLDVSFSSAKIELFDCCKFSLFFAMYSTFPDNFSP